MPTCSCLQKLKLCKKKKKKKQLGSQILTWFLNLIQSNNRQTIQQLSTDCFPSQLEIEQYFNTMHSTIRANPPFKNFTLQLLQPICPVNSLTSQCHIMVISLSPVILGQNPCDAHTATRHSSNKQERIVT